MLQRNSAFLKNLFKVLMIVALAPIGCAETVNYGSNPKAKAFIDEMVKDHGFERGFLEQLFAETEYKESIIKAMNSPAEAKPWKEYRAILVTPQRTEQGKAFLAEQQEALARAESVYGVPAELVVAVIGVETRYGRVTGNFRVVDALATLAFDYPRRADFFRKELKEFLVLTRDEQVQPTALMGSYAGAMGYGQFMPSSFRAYAVDFDGDGKKDIWNNPVDAIGSVANYFHRHGWTPGQPVTFTAAVAGDAYEPMLVVKRADLKPTRTLADLIAAGFVPETELAADQPATAMRLDGEQGAEHWVGLHNFYVITRYNHSALYAMAVFQLSQQIAGRS